MFRLLTCLLVLAVVVFSTYVRPQTNTNSTESPYLMVYMSESTQKAAPKQTQVVLSDPSGRNATTITSGQLLHVYPRIDASGTEVALAQGADEAGLSIVTKDLKTGIVEQWTADKGMNIHPRFSGNARYLAFSAPLGPDNRAQIAIIDLGAARKSVGQKNAPGVVRYEASPRLIASDYDSFFPALSSDGSFVVFQRTKSKTEKDIALYDLTSNRVEIISGKGEEWKSPSLSFDDRWVVYTGKNGENWHIYITDLLTKETKQVTRGTSSELSPAFRPDGSLVFSSDRHGHFELYEIPASEMKNGSLQARPLVQGQDQSYAPSISGDISFSQAFLPDMPAPGRSSFGAITVGNRVFIAGGHKAREHTYAKDTFLSQFEYFNLADRTWHQAAPLPMPCQGFGLASNGKYIYAFGGFAYSLEHKPAWQSLDAIQRYDIQHDRWEQIGSMPRRRSSYALAQIGPKVYLLGGWDATPKSENDKEGHFWPEVDVFDLTTENITPAVGRLPNPLRRAFSAAVVGKEIVLLGGISPGASHFALLNNVTAFNPETGVWRELPPLPFATFAPAAGTLGDRLFVFGGMFKINEQTYKYVNHIFTLGSGGWIHTGRYLEESKGFAQVVDLSPDALGIIGGQSDFPIENSPVLTFEQFALAHR